MNTAHPVVSLHDEEISRIVLDLIEDPRSNAKQIGRILEMAPSLAQRVMDSALTLLKGKGGIKTCAQAVVIIGFRTLAFIVESYRKAIAHMGNDLTAGPHRVTQPIENSSIKSSATDE